MSKFDGKRLSDKTFKLDVERMREGWYSDKYFYNINKMLCALSKEGYTYEGDHNNLPANLSTEDILVGDMEVEMQWFTRRKGRTLVVGVDKALEMIRLCAGHFDGDTFVNTPEELDVWAVQDGDMVESDGDPLKVQPVIRVRGKYRDFALIETPTLGILTRSSRIATNVYETFKAADGKPVLFFPARFDSHEVQASDGYAYNIALQRFNLDATRALGPFISTDAQGDWWGGAGGGTIAHAAIASFLGDTAEGMMAFSRILPVEIPRIALVDFNNDSVRDTLYTLDAMFKKYRALVESDQLEEAKKYILFGVRLDTSGSLRDVSVPPMGDPVLDLGVTPRLVFIVRDAINEAWKKWDLPGEWAEKAKAYCENVKIVVSGGFNPEKIRRFEKLGVPADIYAVGSSLFNNNGETVTDFTADVVKVKINGEWVEMAKVGRKPLDNADLKKVW